MTTPHGDTSTLADPGQLPHLLALLEDDSPVVQQAIAAEFRRFGPGLREALAELDEPLDRLRRERLARILGRSARDDLRRAWSSWYGLEGQTPQLEAALTLIADFQDHAESVISDEPPVPVSLLLDELAERFRGSKAEDDPRGLAKFLFEERRLRGAAEDYYAPRNSNLRYVVQQGLGIPISLAAIYMLVGRRCGYRIGGCNWPGHFLARMEIDRKPFLVDCFNDGRCMELEAFLSTQGPSKDAAQRVLEEDTDATTIVGRVLNNLVRAYRETDQEDDARCMLDLLQDLEQHITASRRG